MRALTILSISFLSFNFSFCQLNDSILNNQKIWYNHIYVYWDWSIDTEVLGLGNDTIVNDTNYFQVLSTPEGHVPEQWIEGIGSYSGLLHNYNGYTGGDAFYLSCVKYSGDMIFKRSESDPCIKLATGLDDINPYGPMISPNPIGVNQELRIRTNSVRSIFELYDAVGILVYREILISKEISIMVNVTPGIYIYRLIDDKGINLKSGSLIFK